MSTMMKTVDEWIAAIATRRETGSHGRKPWKLRLAVAGCLAAIVTAGALSVRSFAAAGAFPQIVAIASGVDLDANLKAKVKGPTDVLVAELKFETGGDTGWHIHPGPVAVVIKSGSLTEIDKNGCVTEHPAGSVFFESENVVHKAVSMTGPSDVFVTFISPQGLPPLIPVPDPPFSACKQK